jgi:hypothetical protein
MIKVTFEFGRPKAALYRDALAQFEPFMITNRLPATV